LTKYIVEMTTHLSEMYFVNDH